MATAFRYETVHFDPTSGIRQNEPGTATFNTRVRSAAVALNGFSIGFNNGEHPILKQEINIRQSDVRIQGNTVEFTVDFLMLDASGNIDDPFGGYVDVLVIADVD